jgi:hypothetical protein
VTFDQAMAYKYLYQVACKRLADEALQPSPDYRKLVGHANLIDTIDDEVEKFEQQKYILAAQDRARFAARHQEYQLNEAEWKKQPIGYSKPVEVIAPYVEILSTKQLPIRNHT